MTHSTDKMYEVHDNLVYLACRALDEKEFKNFENCIYRFVGGVLQELLYGGDWVTCYESLSLFSAQDLTLVGGENERT